MTTRIVGLDEARRNLSAIVNGIEAGERRYLLSSRGRPRAVLMSVADYMRTILKQKKATIVAEIQLEAAEKGLNRLKPSEIEREIRAVRKKRA